MSSIKHVHARQGGATLEGKAAAMRQKPSIVLAVIAALLVVGAKVVAPTPGLTRELFHRFTVTKQCAPVLAKVRRGLAPAGPCISISYAGGE